MVNDGPIITTLDIETSPNLADVWGLWQQNVALSQLREVSSVIAFAAKIHGRKAVEFRSQFHDGHDVMIRRAHEMLDDTDILVTYNGKKFDTPHLRREFLLLGLAPPSPFIEVDLCQVVKSRFRFSSNKLDHVASQLGLGEKVKHDGHDLWVRCLAGDEKAWAQMRTYNIRDVVLTEQLYDALIPWVPNHPNVNLWTAEDGCPNCGKPRLQKRGFYRKGLTVRQRYQCQDCGTWATDGKRLDGATVRGTA